MRILDHRWILHRFVWCFAFMALMMAPVLTTAQSSNTFIAGGVLQCSPSQIILAQSEVILPVTSSLISEGTTIFQYDLSGIDRKQLPDILVRYLTGGASDINADLFNWKSSTWVQLSNASGGITVPTWHVHTLAFEGFAPDDFIDEKNELLYRVRSHIMGVPEIRGIQINPAYKWISLRGVGSGSINGLTQGLGNFWVCIGTSIWSISPGNMFTEFPDRGQFRTLAFDGESFWGIRYQKNGATWLEKEDINWTASGQFSIVTATTSAGGLTYADGKLWLSQYSAEYGETECYLYGIAPDESVLEGKAVVTDQYPFDGVSRGLTYDGKHLLMAMTDTIANSSSYLQVWSIETGALIRTYSIPVPFIMDVAFDGEALWVLHQGWSELTVHSGPISQYHTGYAISRFELEMESGVDLNHLYR